MDYPAQRAEQGGWDMADDGSRRILELVRQDEAVLLQRWVAMAVAPLQGRLTPAELTPVFGELLATLTAALDKGDLDIRSDNYAGPRALLAEMSRDWARRGFTSTEMASSVFSIKEALFALADGAGEPHQTVITIPAGSTRSGCTPSRHPLGPASR